jgi:ABC-type branched-subunit amino acid transport system ATPase component
MDPKSNRLRQQQQNQEGQELTSAQQQSHQRAHEFARAEELLRFDAARMQVPPAIAHRLNESMQHEPRAANPWWKRWFGRATL